VNVFYCDHFAYPLPEGHRFPARKYPLLRQQVAASLVPPRELRVPAAACEEQLLLAHDRSYLTRVVNGELTAIEAKNFPFHKERSDLDVELPDRTGDDAYIEALEAGLRHTLESAHADLVIYLAGADPFAGDTLGRLSLSKAGLAERDRLVFSLCQQAGLPVAVVMAGGYARPIQDTVDIHFQTVHIATGLS